MKQKHLILGSLVGLAVVSGYFYADYKKHEVIKERIDMELMQFDGTSTIKYGTLDTSLFSNAVTLKNVSIDTSGLSGMTQTPTPKMISIESVTVDSKAGLSSLNNSQLPPHLEVTLHRIATEVDFKQLAQQSYKPVEKAFYQVVDQVTEGKPTTDFYLEYDYEPAKENTRSFIDITLKSELNKVAKLEVKAEIENMPLDPVVLMLGGMQRALIHHFQLEIKEEDNAFDLMMKNTAKQMNVTEKAYQAQLTEQLKKRAETSRQPAEQMFYEAMEDFVEDLHKFKVDITPKQPMTLIDIQKLAAFAKDSDELEEQLKLEIKGK
ncbi:hypothetical protein GCM10025856_01720 [Methylophaga marina]|uniref:DUF748 domain-containing protein n=1 Tax=Methylophaga marina TaxID=45495 RepID=A0ABN0TCI8_9GAMM|nr:hypothetical protein [Methylophaga marina]BDZ72453.1 hypothetical protein GCM10025856_01720 [Methylophaga marina]